MRTSADGSLRRLARPRLYEQVVGRLREYVRSANLHADDRLPAERELADRLGVSRTSVRQAIVALEVQGLIEVRHGDGTYLLRDRLEAEPLQAMIERKQLLPHVLDARDAAETKLAELAAARRQDSDLRALDKAIAAMRVAVAAGELGLAENQQFHEAVTAAARSPLLMIGFTGVAASDVLLAIMFKLPESTTRSYLILVFIMLFVFFVQTFIGTLIWLMLSEIFPMAIRGYCMGIAVFFLWSINTAISYVFPYMITNLGSSGTFAVFAGINVISLLFCIRFAPETRGRTLEELADEFRSRDAGKLTHEAPTGVYGS